MAGVDAFTLEAGLALGGYQHVDDAVTRDMPSLHQHRLGAQGQQGLAGAAQVVGRLDHQARKRCGFRRIGREQSSARDHQAFDRADRGFGEQSRATLGDHHRVDDGGDLARVIHGGGHGLDHDRVAQHAGLDRVGADLVEDGARLRRDHVQRDRMDARDAQGVLHRNGRDGRGRVAAQGGDGLDVGLDPRATAGIGTGDDEDAAS
jgi:hypothetical protein